MAKPHAESSLEALESKENLAFQERSWRWEVFGRWLVGLLVVAAILGLLGGGPLSHGEVASADGRLRVEYPRIARTDSTYRMTVHVDSTALVNQEVDVWLEAELLETMQVEGISPQPSEVALDRQRLRYTFRAAAGGELAPITFHVKLDGAGRYGGQIGLSDNTAVSLAFWLYP